MIIDSSVQIARRAVSAAAPRRVLGARALYGIAIGAVLLAGCVANVDREDVAEQTEPLYNAANFQIGIVPIKYVGNKVLKGTEAWTSAFDVAALSVPRASYSGWASGFTDETGVRIALRSLGDGPPILALADFRLTIAAGDDSTIVRTAWASEDGSETTFSSTLNLSRYKVGIETRSWPSWNGRRLGNFRIGVRGCDYAGCGDMQFTDWLMNLPANSTSWSHTAGGNVAGASTVTIRLQSFFN